MSGDVLVLSTRAPAPRPVGGGLDDPAPCTPRRAPESEAQRGYPQRPATAPKSGPKPHVSSPPPLTPAAEASPCLDRPPRRRPIDQSPDMCSTPADAVLRVTTLAHELAAVAEHLAPVVPAPHADPTVEELARIAAHKLAGHQDCHEAWHPSPSLDAVRSQCQTLLRSLCTAEAIAVVTLLGAELSREVGA